MTPPAAVHIVYSMSDDMVRRMERWEEAKRKSARSEKKDKAARAWMRLDNKTRRLAGEKALREGKPWPKWKLEGWKSASEKRYYTRITNGMKAYMKRCDEAAARKPSAEELKEKKIEEDYLAWVKEHGAPWLSILSGSTSGSRRSRPPGRPVEPDPRRYPIQVLLTEEERAAVHDRAAEEGITASSWIRGLILKALRRS